MLVITSTRGYPFKGSVHFRHSSEPGNRWLFSPGEDIGFINRQIFGCPICRQTHFKILKKAWQFQPTKVPPLPESCCFRCLPLFHKTQLAEDVRPNSWINARSKMALLAVAGRANSWFQLAEHGRASSSRIRVPPFCSDSLLRRSISMIQSERGAFLERTPAGLAALFPYLKHRYFVDIASP